MSIHNSYIAWILLWSGTTCWAQVPAVQPAESRFYASLQLASGQYTVIYKPSGFPTAIPLSPWRVAAGYQLTPRLCLELNGMYRSEGSSGSATGTTATGQPVLEYTTEKSRSGALPLLARYTLTARPIGSLYIEVLAGGTATKTRAESSYTRTIAGQVVTDRQEANYKTSFYYTAGLGTRYCLGQHWQVVVDWTLNRNMERLAAAVSQQVLGRSIDVTYAYGLGVRYCFRTRPTP